MEKLRRCVIKQELVELTGCFKKALILNQLLYWTERVKDYDKLMHEEQIRSIQHGEGSNNFEPFHGWIYKTAEELSLETMLGLSKSNMLKHINDLVSTGYIMKRNNPRYKWDKTFQYRVDVFRVQVELFKLGYALEGYPIINEGVLKQYSSFISERQGIETVPQYTETQQQYQRLLTKINNIDINNNNERTYVPFYNWLEERE